MIRLLLTFAFAGLALYAPPRADAELNSLPGSNPSKEYQVKAAFLFNFAQFVEWPGDAFSRPEDSIVIGVLGTDPFGTYLDNVVQGEKIGARPIAIRRFGKVEDVAGCHILFIGGADPKLLEPVLNTLRKRPILTVGEADDFSRAGGVICFAMQQNRIRLKINVEAAEAARLSISSKLLKLAEIVAPEKR